MATEAERATQGAGLPGLPPREGTAAQGPAFRDSVTVEALLDAAFRAAGYWVCECGSVTEPPAAVCHACLTGNRRLGPLYGGSLAGHAATASPQPDGAELEAWVAMLCAENRNLRGQLADAQAAVVRAGKRGGAE